MPSRLLLLPPPALLQLLLLLLLVLLTHCVLMSMRLRWRQGRLPHLALLGEELMLLRLLLLQRLFMWRRASSVCHRPTMWWMTLSPALGEHQPRRWPEARRRRPSSKVCGGSMHQREGRDKATWAETASRPKRIIHRIAGALLRQAIMCKPRTIRHSKPRTERVRTK